MARRSIEDMRNNPNGHQLRLREAVKRLGLKIEEYYAGYRRHLGWTGLVSFEMRVTMPNGSTGVIFFKDCGDHNKPSSPTNWRARTNRLSVIRSHKFAACEVWAGTVDEDEAQLQLWLMTYERQPLRLAQNKNPFNRQKQEAVTYARRRLRNRRVV